LLLCDIIIIIKYIDEYLGGIFITMPEFFYDEMNKMFDELGVNLEDTDDKEKIKQASDFIATFTPDTEPIVIE